MANLVRSAKSGSHWTKNELLAFNIRVATVDLPAFFGCTELPPAPNFPVFLTNLDRPGGPLPKNERQFFQYMEAADKASSEESAVNDFAAFILRTLGYDEPDCLVRLRKEMSFYMAGESVDANADVCVMNDLDYLLLVQEDKRSQSAEDPEPQLIAEAIAAFYQNNFRRTRAGLAPLPPTLIPGITMAGTSPIFYCIPVSNKLLDALVTASFPASETVVLRFIPPVPDLERYFFDGMRPLQNRHIVLQCFEAFKGSVNKPQSQI